MVITRFLPVIALCVTCYSLSTGYISPALFHAVFTPKPSASIRAPAFAGRTLPASQILPLIGWVEDRTNTDLSPLPIVTTASIDDFHCWLPAKEYGGKIVGAEKGGKIFIDDKFSDLSKPENAAIVVHELTHYAQELSGRTFACRSQREAEAYEQQNEFLSEHNQPPTMDAENIARMKKCLPTDTLFD